MFADDRRRHPMTFFLRTEFLGDWNAEQFSEAAEKARQRHPLLCSIIVGVAESRTSELFWEPFDAAVTIDVEQEGAEDQDLDATHLDPTEELPLRIRVRRERDKVQVLFQFHHVATDGIGALRYVEDLLILYGQLAGERLSLPEVDAKLLPGRDKLPAARSSRPPAVWRTLQRVVSYLMHFPQRLASAGPRRQPGPSEWPHPVRFELTAQEVARLKRTAARQDGTLNDLLVARLFQTLDTWNRERGRPRPLRLAMAVNLRRPEDERMPAANVVAMTFLDRTASEAAADTDRLLAGIVEETRELKAGGMGSLYLIVAEWMGSLRGGLRELMNVSGPASCGATAVLSNLGEVFKQTSIPRDRQDRLTMGGLTLSRIELLPPVRPGTALAIGVATYGERMALSARYDPMVLSQADAEALMHAFEVRLRRDVTP